MLLSEMFNSMPQGDAILQGSRCIDSSIGMEHSGPYIVPSCFQPVLERYHEIGKRLHQIFETSANGDTSL